MATTNIQSFAGQVEVTSNLTVDTSTFHVNSQTNSVGLGTTLPLSTLHVVGNVYATSNVTFSDSTASSSKTTGALKVAGGVGISGALYGAAATFDGAVSTGALTTSSNLAVDTNVLFVDTISDRVGMGTTKPSTVLDIYRLGLSPYIRITRDEGSPNEYTPLGTEIGGLQFMSDDLSWATQTVGSEIVAVQANPNYSGTTHHLVFKTASTGGSATTEKMRITDSGNVGIGTTSPIYKLDVASTGNPSSATVNHQALRLYNDNYGADDTIEMLFKHGTSGVGEASAKILSYLPGGNDAGLKFFTTDNSTLSSTPLLILTGNQTVGIATSVPAKTFHVAGQSVFSTNISTQNDARVYNADVSIVKEIGYGASGTADLDIGATTSAMGNYTATYRYKLYTDVADYNSKFKIAKVSGAAGTYNGYGTTTDILTIDPTGKVGIGTTSPDSSLHIYTASSDSNGSQLTIGGRHDSVSYNTNLRLGANTAYTWIQSHHGAPLTLNPAGNNVGIGTTNPTRSLQVHRGQSYVNGGTSNNAAFEIVQALGTDDYTYLGQHRAQFRINSGLGSQSNRSFELALLDNGTGVIQANAGSEGYFPLAINPVGDYNSPVMVGALSKGSHKFTVNGNAFVSSDLTAANILYVRGASSRVGIGSASPGEKLHIFETATNAAALKLDNGVSNHTIRQKTGEPTLQFESYPYASSGDYFRWLTWNSSNNGWNYRLTMKYDGTVGIGTDNPSARLHVHGGTYVSGGNNTSPTGGLTQTTVLKYGLRLVQSGSVNWNGSTRQSSFDQGLIFTMNSMNPSNGTSSAYWAVGVNYDIQDSNLLFSCDGRTTCYIPPNHYNEILDFTGQHRSFIYGIPFTQYTNYEGLIVSANKNKYFDVDKNVTTGSNAIQISQSLPLVSLSKIEKDKACFGVISGVEDPDTREYDSGGFVRVAEKQVGDTRAFINSVGEGAIWVTNINGPLESGDYITTSNVPGYGQKQDDDILHNYTVAKITMDCDFNPATQPIQRIVKELANVNYWINTTYSNVTLEEYSNLVEASRTTEDVAYYTRDVQELVYTPYEEITEIVTADDEYDDVSFVPRITLEEYSNLTTEEQDAYTVTYTKTSNVALFDTLVYTKGETTVTSAYYDGLTEEQQSAYTPKYTKTVTRTLELDAYEALTAGEQATCTEHTRTIYKKIIRDESKTETQGWNLEVRQELVNVLDEHGQLQWEDDPSGATEKAYKIRYLTADGQITDEANAVHIAAFVGCTYHCG